MTTNTTMILEMLIWIVTEFF